MNHSSTVWLDYLRRKDYQTYWKVKLLQRESLDEKIEQATLRQSNFPTNNDHENEVDNNFKQNELQTILKQVGHLQEEKQRSELTLTCLINKKEEKIQELEKLLEKSNEETKRIKENKENLLIEMKSCIDEMQKERENIEKEMTQLRLQLQNESDQRQYFEIKCQTNQNQSEEFQQKSFSQIIMKDFVDNQMNLAYERGQLLTKIDQLQEEITNLHKYRNASEYLQNRLNVIEDNYQRTQNQLLQCQNELENLENQHKKLQETNHLLKRNLETCEEERDNALIQVQKSFGNIFQLNEQENKHVHELKKRIEILLNEKGQMQQNLEKITIHNFHLQEKMKLLQTDLGRKDAWIVQLREETANVNDNLYTKLKELENCQKNLREWENRERREWIPLKERQLELERLNKQLMNEINSNEIKSESNRLEMTRLKEELCLNESEYLNYKKTTQYLKNQWKKEKEIYQRKLQGQIERENNADASNTKQQLEPLTIKLAKNTKEVPHKNLKSNEEKCFIQPLSSSQTEEANWSPFLVEQDFETYLDDQLRTVQKTSFLLKTIPQTFFGKDNFFT